MIVSRLNPEPRTPRPAPRRRGVTIIEVLFAILVTTVGLFGALAVFPVASAQARRARLNDMLAVAGRSAFHDFDTRGMRRPDRWLAYDGKAYNNNGGFVPVLSVQNRQANESFCLDPRFVADNIAGNALPTNAWSFPCYNGSGDLIYVGSMTFNNFDSTLMRRITLWSGYTNAAGQMIPLTMQQANAIFVVPDDISYDRSTKEKSAPAQQLVANLGNAAAPLNTWGSRLADGKISWFATLVPQFDLSGIQSDQYTLSIVMLNERQSPLRLAGASTTENVTKERIAVGQFLDPTGATGGEILLQAATAEHLKLRPNDWIMVSGTYLVTVSTTPVVVQTPLTRFHWYRVSDCDAEPSPNAAGQYELYATLIGQDWNTSFKHPLPAGYSLVGVGATPVRVTIVEGAFAVYEKTIRLEYGSTF